METLEDLTKFCEVARKLGVTDVKIISTDNIVINDRTRLKCQYGCPFYNHFLTCPPFSPPPEQTRKLVSEYKWALLFTMHFSSEVQEGVFQSGVHSIKNMAILQKTAAELEKQIFLSGYHSAFAMVCGPCLLCDECTLQPGKCRNPSIARPAMESMGIDVGETIKKAGYKTKVYASATEAFDAYGLVLIV
jgi:predicted metal-binding protein